MTSDGTKASGVNRNYWSATTKSDNTTNAWNVNLSNGNTNNNGKTNANNVRCVRPEMNTYPALPGIAPPRLMLPLAILFDDAE